MPKRKDGEKIKFTHTRWCALLDLSVGVRFFPPHLDHSIAFYAGGFISNYFSHCEVMKVFIEHNEQFEIQCVDQ